MTNNGPYDSSNTDDAYTPPDVVQPLLGHSKEMAEKWNEMLTSELPFDPQSITGTIGEDPRSEEAYPPSPEDKVEFLTEEGGEEQPLREELQMFIYRSQADPIDTLPPKPLSPTELDELLSHVFEEDDDGSYETWVPMEREAIEKTAVGEYRQRVEGDILRFTLIVDDVASIFMLLPDDSTSGFSWYYFNTTSADNAMASLEAEEGQRLSSLLATDGENILSSVPDRVANASNLLGTFIHQENRSATPDGWFTTYCERDAEASDVMKPRFEATFIREEDEIVLEVTPLPATPLEFDSSGNGLTVSETHDDSPTHEWAISFASDELRSLLEDEFPRQIKGPTLIDIMERIDTIQDDTQ